MEERTNLGASPVPPTENAGVTSSWAEWKHHMSIDCNSLDCGREGARPLQTRFAAWAREATVERGRFTIREAAEVLLGTTSRTEPISALVAELVNQGQVTAYGRLGWRWVEVDAAPVHIAKPARRWTEQSLAAATNRLQAWAVRATEQHGHFRRKDAMRDLELPPGIAKALLAELTRSGVLCRLPGSLGYRVAAVAGPAVNVRRGPTRWTKEALGDLRPRLLEFARSETTARGRFTLGAATEALIGGKNTGPVRQILEELKRDG